jgi:ornithine--oxo-acid transaminase
MTTVISFSTQDKYRAGFGPLTPGFVSVEFGNLDAVKAAINKNTLGIIVNDSHGHTIRISPPLNINESEIGFLVECLEKVFLK